MAKFTNTSTRTPNTVNLAGGAAYAVSDAKKELASVILASMLKGDNYYQSDASRIEQVFELVKLLDDKSFAAKAMIYARQEGNLRSISHVLANALAENNDGSFSLRRAIRFAVIRPDDMIEIFALWKSRHPKMLPNAMRRAFSDLLESNKWDAYQLKKYSRTGQDVKLRDVILMSHPKDSSGMLGKVIEGTLQAPATMEKMLSSGKRASDTFAELLKENRLGYMVGVKNIRNALETGLTNEDLDLWVAMITNRNRVLKSRMLPFRFVDAWESVRDLNIDHFKLNKVKDAFNKAIIHSADNLGFVEGKEKVALVIDVSGSMKQDDAWKHAITLAAVLYHALGKERAVVYKFAADSVKADFGDMSPLDIIERTSFPGGATFFKAPMGRLVQSGTKVDSIIMLTDMQMYNDHDSMYRRSSHDSSGLTKSFDEYFNEYKSKINPRVKMLFWDLRGYGSGTPLELRNDILLASGYSDKLLSLIPKMWKNQDALVQEIEAIRI